MDTSFSFSVQTLSLHDPITFLLAFSHLSFSQRYRSICKTFEKPISWPLLQTLLLSPSHSKSPILLLLFLLLLSFLSLVFSSSSFLSLNPSFFYFFFSSFCFCYPGFFCLSFHYFLYSSIGNKKLLMVRDNKRHRKIYRQM